MKILALDTSCKVASVAITEGAEILAEYTLNPGKNSHSKTLVPMINDIITNLPMSFNDIDIFAASIGPGSFTGLRIGLTTIKAMAYARKKLLVGVPTLDALAYNIPKTDNLICPMIDARNDQVYTSVYQWKHDKLNNLTGHVALHINDILDMINKMGLSVTFVGDAVSIHTTTIQNSLADKFKPAPDNLILQRASSVAYAASLKAHAGIFDDVFTLCPFYLRKSQAELAYEKLNCK